MVVLVGVYPSLKSRLIGGSPVSINQFPYQILIKVPTGDNQFEYCGGSLISPDWVLTAAHCFYGLNLDNVHVTAGTANFNTGGISQLARKVIIHDHYGGPDLRVVNDIALVQVGQAFPFSNSIQTIPVYDGLVTDGTRASVTGWGTVSPTANQIPDQLQVIDPVITISLQQCKNRYPNLQLSTDNLCTTSGNTGTCNGDSGGPLVANGDLLGLVVAGPRPCGDGDPDMYMRVGAYRQWIRDIAGV